MKNKLTYISFFISVFLVNTNAQITNSTNTVGLLYSEPEKVSDGYILFVPLGSSNAYLIDNCGLLVNQWTFNKISVYSGSYLLQDGSVIKVTSPNKNYYYEPGETCIERISWDNELVWQYCIEGERAFFHSDLHILPNGNVLVLLLEYFTVEEAILNGVNPSLIGNDYQLESVVELKPLGMDSAEIVWKWRMIDHLVQDYDASKNNYGVVAENPRRYDANLYDGGLHFNSIDYNQALQQIVVSSWSDHEIYIIDHTTTREEAAGSTGGKYGFGGDFLFRWGNAENYGLDKEQKLLGQHNPRWIPDSFDSFGGMISIFNNRHGELLESLKPTSAVVIINPDPDGDGVYDMDATAGNFLPDNYEYVMPNQNNLQDPIYSEFMSGAVVQPNGNIITCEAETGRLTEFDKEGKMLWRYQSPDGYYYQYNQGQSSLDVAVYKIEKYSADYPGLLNRYLCGTSTIENENELSDQCMNFWKPNMTFSFSVTGTTVDFNLTALNPDSLSWDFGDGNTSVENNPTHIFEMPGNYEVCLSGSNCYGTDRFCETIEITTTSIDEQTIYKPILQTNLVKNQLIFKKNTFEQIIVFNEAGLKVMDIKGFQNKVDSKHLSAGIYFLQAKNFNKNNYKVERFIKL